MAGGTPMTVALVGLALICVGLLAVAFIFLFRFAGEHSVEFFSFLAHESREDDGKEDSAYFPSAKPDLRAIAAAQDFDSALARHAIQNEIEQGGTPPPDEPLSPRNP